MRIDTVCVLGGTGFVGRHLVTRLHALGKRVRVLTRRRERHRELLVLPSVEIVQADVQDPQALARHFAGVDCVVNLVGILNESGHRGEGFRRAHLDLAKKVVATCKAQKVGRLLHMSALNADAGNQSCHYLRTKGEAESHVMTFAGPDVQATSFRPSVIFGPGDGLCSRFATLLRLAPVLPLACPQARFQPVFVGDVVEAMASAMEDPASVGKSITLVGPKFYTLQEIVEFTAAVLGMRRWVLGLPSFASRLQARVLEWVPGKPFSRDNYAALQLDSVAPDAQPCPTAMESVVPRYLGRAVEAHRYQSLRRVARRDG